MSDKNLKGDINELEWVRIFDPYHIPTYLVEQIKERSFPVDKFYKHQKLVCIQNENGKMVLNPLNLLYVLANKQKEVKGFLWALVDPLSNSLVINSFSMDNEYWGEGKAVKLLEQKAKEIQEGALLDKVYWITRCPKHSEKYGFKRSKHVLMEYIGHGSNNDGERCETSGNCGSDEPRTEAVSSNDIGRSGSSVNGGIRRTA